MSKFVEGAKRYGWNVLISVDQLANTLAFGDPDETISERIARFRAEGSHVACVLCKLFDLFDKGHCDELTRR